MSVRIKDLRFKLRYKLAQSRLLSYIYSFIKTKFIAYSSVNNLFKSDKSKIHQLAESKKAGKNVLLATSMGSELVAWRLESILSIRSESPERHPATNTFLPAFEITGSRYESLKLYLCITYCLREKDKSSPVLLITVL